MNLAAELAEGHRRQFLALSARDARSIASTASLVLNHGKTRQVVWIDWSSPDDKAASQAMAWALGALNAGRSRILDSFGGVILVLPLTFESRVADGAVDLWSVRTFAMRVRQQPEASAGHTLSEPRDAGRRQASRTDDPEALPDLERAMRQREQALGPDHPDTVRSRADVAEVYVQLGRLEEALPLLERALVGCERALGPDHPDTLRNRESLADVHVRLGQLESALPLLERTVADRERVFGPDHRSTLRSRRSLALVEVRLGRLREAVPLLERTLAGRERVLGPDHPDTLESRRDLLEVYTRLEQYTKALPLLQRILTDSQRLLGPDHPDTLRSRHEFARALAQIGQLAGAVPVFERVLVDRERLLGPDHPDTRRTRIDLGIAETQLRRQLVEALPRFERGLLSRRQLLGPDHPHTLKSAHDLACLYAQLGRLEEATQLFERALVDRERVLGPDHPDTLDTRHQLREGAASQELKQRSSAAIDPATEPIAGFEPGAPRGVASTSDQGIAPHTRPFAPDEVLRASVVRILTARGDHIGTGYAVGDGTVLATAAHVAKGGAEDPGLRAESVDGATWPLLLVRVDEGLGVAVLKSVSVVREPVKEALESEIRRDERVFALIARGGGWKREPGLVVGSARLDPLKEPAMLFRPSLTPGSAGAPVVTGGGDVVGMVYAIRRRRKQTFLIPGRLVWNAISPAARPDQAPAD